MFFLSAVMLVCLWLLTAPVPAAAGSVPAAVIFLPENQTAVLVEKLTQRFYVYRADPDTRTLDLVFETACSTGEMPGPKQVEGDKKTPEGIYFLIDEYEDRYLSPIYGKKAFPTDYPNFMDRHQGKTGSAIWIHGTDKELKPMDTNGCIALENEDVESLSSYVTLDFTPLIIQEKILYADPKDLQKKKERIMQFVDNWAQAHLTGSYQQYISFYAPGYQLDIQWWDAWVKLRQSSDNHLENISILTPVQGVYQHEKTMVVLMDFWLALGRDRQFLGRRKLFIRENRSSGLQIVGDIFNDQRQKPHRGLF
ncbi:MAG: L,D-transpeptidase family protein [Desulfotignum sp.]|nr:L,D-transpeptidase family protein [Desulfotignum sp.]